MKGMKGLKKRTTAIKVEFRVKIKSD